MAKDAAGSTGPAQPVNGSSGGLKLKLKIGGGSSKVTTGEDASEHADATDQSSSTPTTPKLKLSVKNNSNETTIERSSEPADDQAFTPAGPPRIKLSVRNPSHAATASASSPVVATRQLIAQPGGGAASSRGKKRKSISSSDGDSTTGTRPTDHAIKRRKSKLNLVVSADANQDGEAEVEEGAEEDEDDDTDVELQPKDEEDDVAASGTDGIKNATSADPSKLDAHGADQLAAPGVVKDEPMDDPSAVQFYGQQPADSPADGNVDDQDQTTATPSQFDSAAQTPTETPIAPSGRRAWAPKRKPLVELLRKYITELRRKDTYGLFLEPVNEEEYPGYLDAIGGSDKAMDLATMERKIEDRAYRSFQQVEDDIDKMCTAAQKFNAEDSLVVKEAEKMRALSEKYRNRFEPLVKTPSPEPDPSANATPFDSAAMSPSNLWDAGSLGYTPGRSMSPSKMSRMGDGKPRSKHVSEIEPRSLIPEKMLEYPANSAIAATVGWYYTGGKRQRTRKEQKSREKWDGQWREWYTCGHRRLPEAEDAPALMTDGFLLQGSRDGTTLPEIYDFQAEIMEESEVWQPTPTLTGVVIDEETPTIPTKLATHLDFGPLADLPARYGHPETRRWTHDALLNEIQGELGGEQDENDPLSWVKAMTIGEDVRSEAYHRSINGFLRGALDIANARTKGVQDIQDAPDLASDVYSRWRGGVLRRQRQFVDRATREYYSQTTQGKNTSPPKDPVDLVGDGKPVDLIKSTIAATKARIPVQRDLAEYAARRDGLDLACLLKSQADFAYTGSFQNPPPPSGPEKIIWFQRIINGTGRQIIAIAEGSTEKPEKPLQVGRDLLTSLRLDLVSFRAINA